MISILIFLILMSPMIEAPFGWLSPAVITIFFVLTMARTLIVQRIPCGVWGGRYFLFFGGILVAEFVSYWATDGNLRYPLSQIVLLLLALSVYLSIGQKKSANIESVVNGWLTAAAALSILILLESFGVLYVEGAVFPIRTSYGFSGLVYRGIGVPQSDGRLGTILVPALCMALVRAGLCTGRFRKFSAWGHRRTGFFLTILIGAAILLVQSRSAYLATAFALSLLFFMAYRKRIDIMFQVGLLATIFFGYVLFFTSWVSQLIGHGQLETNVYGRFDFIAEAFQEFLLSPVWGVGHAGAKFQQEVIHNLFADRFAATGIIGGVSLLALFIIAIFASRKVCRQCGFRSTLWVLGAAISAQIVELMLYRGLYNEPMYILTALTVAAADFIPRESDAQVVRSKINA